MAAGLGVALVPDTHGRARSRVTLLPITDSGATREIGVAWSGEQKLLPAVELFRQHTMAQAALLA